MRRTHVLTSPHPNGIGFQPFFICPPHGLPVLDSSCYGSEGHDDPEDDDCSQVIVVLFRLHQIYICRERI